MDKQTTQLLQQLEDIELPVDPTFAIAPGWWSLALMVVVVLVTGWLLWRRRRAQSPSISHIDWREQARSELQSLRSAVPARPGSDVLSDCSRLARQVALARSARSDVSALTGAAWLARLDELSGTRRFSSGAGRLLESHPYRRCSEVSAVEMDELFDALATLITAREPSSS